MLTRQEIEEIRVAATDQGGEAATSASEEILQRVNQLGLDEEAESATTVLIAYYLLENVHGRYKSIGLAIYPSV